MSRLLLTECDIEARIPVNIMYGKVFESMYRGSMVGSGSVTFAVWGYVIATMRPDKAVGAQVELNPKLLAMVIGERQELIEQAIERLCRPDPKSRTKTAEGRKLIRLGEFDYQVVNGAKYAAIRNEEQRREAARIRKQNERSRKKTAAQVKAENDGRQARFEAAELEGDQEACDRIAAEGTQVGTVEDNP